MVKLVGRFSLFAVLVVALIAEVDPASRVRRVVGGYDAEEGEFPYQVSLRYRGRHICGGVIISSRHILTAGHCVDGISVLNNFVVVTGSISIRRDGQRHYIRRIVRHPQYGGRAEGPNDIAIIVLAANIRFDPYQHAIRLPHSPAQPGDSVIVTGWGYPRIETPVPTNTLMKLRMRIVSGAKCQRYYSFPQYNHQICAFAGRGVGACRYDSGGPLAINNVLVGIVSYGSPCARGVPDVFTSVYHFRRWITYIVSNT